MRILLLNDLGFQYGAGVAAARQIQSLLLGGHVVRAVCGADGGLGDAPLFTRDGLGEGWRGMTTLGSVFRAGRSDAEVIDTVLSAIAPFYPDVVIAGNLHGGWPLGVLGAVRRLGCRVIGYLHDLNPVTGRCIYPGSCDAYLRGCDARCPTTTEYPPLDPAHVAGAWRLRRELFNGPQGIELAANSEYVRAAVTAAMPAARVRTVYLGADEQLFRPGDRAEARRRLGLPSDRPIVLTGAVNLTDRRKGAHLLPQIVERLGSRTQVVAFGHASAAHPAVRTLGYQTDPRAQALAYQAADVFLGMASEEAFGQTMLEAGLSGVPSVAFGVGGIPEIVESGRTGLLVRVGDAAALSDAVSQLVADPALAARLGAAARSKCEAEFSLTRQLAHWTDLLGPAVEERRVA